ncbi:MAG TPA: hypothetical protein VFZ83_05430 [Acidimicrobiia bacterium]|nr:hypothetical protein [Acidimicrobiia bacterium]
MSLTGWGSAPAGPPDATVAGTDADLAAAVRAHPRARFAFEPAPGSDLARALGMRPHHRDARVELPLDALEGSGDRSFLAVNAVVLGTPPGRLRRWSRARRCTVRVDDRPRWSGPATTVVVAVGQFVAGADLVPRGHPADGRAELQVYAVGRGERAQLRRRLATGMHLPHPGIAVAAGRTFDVHWSEPVPIVVDGVPTGTAGRLRIAVLAGAYSLVV